MYMNNHTSRSGATTCIQDKTRSQASLIFRGYEQCLIPRSASCIAPRLALTIPRQPFCDAAIIHYCPTLHSMILKQQLSLYFKHYWTTCFQTVLPLMNTVHSYVKVLGRKSLQCLEYTIGVGSLLMSWVPQYQSRDLPYFCILGAGCNKYGWSCELPQYTVFGTL